jgi:hypothetical protein
MDKPTTTGDKAMATLDINKTAEYYVELANSDNGADNHYAETVIRPRLNAHDYDVVTIEGTSDHRLVYTGSKVI